MELEFLVDLDHPQPMQEVLSSFRQITHLVVGDRIGLLVK